MRILKTLLIAVRSRRPLLLLLLRETEVRTGGPRARMIRTIRRRPRRPRR